MENNHQATDGVILLLFYSFWFYRSFFCILGLLSHTLSICIRQIVVL